MSACGTSRTSGGVRLESAKWVKADIGQVAGGVGRLGVLMSSISRAIPSNDRCDGCGASFDAEPRAPVLIDATWAKLAAPQETLYASCLLNRAMERRVDFSITDLVPCPFNRWRSPSWFDLFSQLK